MKQKRKRKPIDKKWRSYEEVAAYLIDQFATVFGLTRVEGKQKVPGKKSGTHYEIDAKGFHQDGCGFVIVECRRYTSSKQNQDKLAALAYRIIDTGAAGGIIVNPIGLQEGATRIAKAENIVPVLLDENSTRTDYVLQWLNKTMVGVSAQLRLNASLEAVAIVRDKDGNIKP